MNYLILVNKNNKVPDNYLNEVELIKTTNYDNKEVHVEKETYKHYLKLKEYLKTKNIDISIESSYRTIEKQQSIWNDYLEEKGLDYCNKYVAVPGYSEHHTGLCIDIIFKVNNEYIVDNIAENDNPIYKEIHKVLQDYGFILRYPKNKEEITGYNYEPWHIRYVGTKEAQEMRMKNLTLEEYLNKN